MGLGEGILTKLHPEARAYIEELEQQAASSQRWRRRHQALEVRYEQLIEELRLLLYKRFARSSETYIDASQVDLFAESEESARTDEVEEQIVVAAHSRKARGRKSLDEKLPRVEILHDIAEEEKRCACGHELTRIGEEISERVQTIPEQIYVERHIRPKYACHHCEGSADEEKPAVRIAAAPPSMIPGSIVTPGLLGFILVNKFCDHLPFYRQEARFERIGIHISRQDMSNWTIAAAKRLSPLIELMHREIRSGPVVQIDETTVQVLDEPGRANTTKSYMWLARGGPPPASVVLYSYRPTRGSEFPRHFLDGYRGYLQTDGYEVYDRVTETMPEVIHVGCWAHVRRKFFEASKATKKTGAAEQALSIIGKLYHAESRLRATAADDPASFLTKRRQAVQPLLTKFKSWLDEKAAAVVPSTLLGKAVGYAIAQWPKLVRYLDCAELTPDTNAAENAIRPFVLGRKNWLFSGSPRGAESSCAIYSLIQTAKQSGFNPFAYLHYLFTQVPLITHPQEWEKLLPANLQAEQINTAFLASVR